MQCHFDTQVISLNACCLSRHREDFDPLVDAAGPFELNNLVNEDLELVVKGKVKGL